MEDFKKLSSKSPNWTSKSSRNFENTAIVGLGIVAAMEDSEEAFASARFRISAILAPRSSSANSNPIDIVNGDSSRGGALMEFCETYDRLENDTDTHGRLFRTSKFLEICFLCSKNLHGRDIFMYRGEKAFCSAECRSHQIANDDRKEKCGSGLNYSVSPCSGPMMFFAGVVAS